MGRKLYRNADSEYLVSKIREVGSRSKLDRVKLVSASIAISNRDTSDILSGLENIASDGLVSPIEKRQLDMLYRQLKAEYPTVASEAEKYKKLSDWKTEYTAHLEAYEKAYSDFSALLSEILKDMKSSSPVSQAQLSAIAQAYYTALKTLDSTLQQFRYGIDRIEFRYKTTQTQTKPDADEVTLKDVPTLSSTDKYLWRKQTIHYTSGKVDVTVDLIAVYGDNGEDAKVCTIVCDRDYVERNDRLSDSLVYTFTIEVQGYAGNVTVEANGVDRTSGLESEGSRYTLKVTIARKEAYPLTVVVKLDGEEMARLELSVIDRTGSALYLGDFSDSLPASSQYGMLIEGDYFIASETFTDSKNNQYSKGVPYVYRKDGSNWVWSELESTDKDYNTKMLECIGGVMKSGIAVPSTAALYGWFKNLVAQNAVFATLASNEAFIKLLKVYSLFVGTGSRTSGFYVEIADHQKGSSTQEILFNVWFNGSKVFSIDPSTGNIFLGEPKPSLASPASGFMYRKSDGAIVSANEGIIIDKDGVVSSGKGGVFRIFSDFEEGCIAPWKTAYLTGTKYEYMDFSNVSASNAAAIGALLESLFTQYSSAVKTGVSAQWEGYENAEMLYVYADTVDHTKLLLFTDNFSQNGDFTATHYIERFTYTGSSSSFYSNGSTYYEFGVIDNKLKSGGKPLTWYYNPIFKDSDGDWTIPIQPYNYRMHLWGIAAGMTLYGDVMPTGKVWRACFN